jgi:hypothetical protein
LNSTVEGVVAGESAGVVTGKGASEDAAAGEDKVEGVGESAIKVKGESEVEVEVAGEVTGVVAGEVAVTDECWVAGECKVGVKVEVKGMIKQKRPCSETNCLSAFIRPSKASQILLAKIGSVSQHASG